ncbi:hypothetical protein ACFQY0_10870 [Haloferula chungangensis]|uniref:Uncharacterized protein n=1 Tax=Haloferula chungangensis TaxID=1048331 RepID=A0ABW2L933_9BACT
MSPLLKASLAVLLVHLNSWLSCPAETLDSIQFGEPEMEASHGLMEQNSKLITGAIELPARQLLPATPEHWRGGSLTFTMKVDPAKQNYFTCIFWGGDLTGEHSRLMLFIDGKQVGQRHLGEVDMLDIMYNYPRYPGNFYYKTTPLPENITKGRESVELRIEAQGPIWGYGDTFERFQRVMSKPSRGIYGGFTHNDPYFSAPAGDPKAVAVAEYPVRREPGPEALGEIKERINTEIGKMLKSKRDLNQEAIRFLAKACLEPWCDAYHNKTALEVVVAGIDRHYLLFKEDPQVVEKEWHGFGQLGDAVRLLENPLRLYIDQKVEGSAETRREAWTKMFATSRDRKVTQRRSYTNQSMIVDMNIYTCNRAVRALSPTEAWPEPKAVSLLHESAGIEPWSGSWDERGNPSWSLGKSHMLLTDQGLTKELGYVGHYGEIVIGMMLEAYESTRPTMTSEGDPRLKEQLIKMSKARGVFRYPLPDGDGYRSMHIETVIGWRDWYFPGGTTYEQMWTEAPMEVAAATLDPVLIGYGQQMLEDNQYFASLKKRSELRGVAPLTRLLSAPGTYQKIMEQPKSKTRLPMAPGQPSFVFSDPEIGVLALKNGDDLLYVSLYWRARYAINKLARIHHLTPNVERDVTMKIETRFEESGDFFELPDQTNEPFSRRHERAYKDEGMELAVAGEKQPIAKVPPDQTDYKPGKENPYAGKGDFYLAHYGPYLIAMNCTKQQTFQLEVPEEFKGSKDLVSGRTVSASSLTLKPWQTLVLFR